MSAIRPRVQARARDMAKHTQGRNKGILQTQLELANPSTECLSPGVVRLLQHMGMDKL